jgi:hypothetical protein
MALLTQQQWEVFKRRFDGKKKQKSTDYDKTFQMTADGVVRVTDTKEMF